MGRELAAMALAIVSTKEVEHFRPSPGGYFHGMVAKAKVGELHFERTVWASRRAAEPGHREGLPPYEADVSFSACHRRSRNADKAAALT